MRYVKKGFLTFALIFILFQGLTQSVRDISTKDGLPQSFVSGLVQDDSAFIWIGTRNGLARYDGSQFRVFQHDSRDETTLASNLIIWIRKDLQNQLWIEYESGEIDRMNPVTEKITHFLKGNGAKTSDVQFIRRGWLVDGEGIFWGISKGAGINNFDTLSKKRQLFNRMNSGFSSDTVLGITEVKAQGIWILEEKAIHLFNKKTNQFSHWAIPFKQDYGNFSGYDAIAIDLHERKNGELMWGDRQKLYFFQPATQKFRTVILPDTGYLGIRWIRTSSDGFEYVENYGKVYRYNEANGLASIGKTIKENFGDVKSFLVDRSGLIWLGTNAQGIHLIDLETPFFQSYVYKNNFTADMLQQEMGINMQQMFNWNAISQQFSQPGYYFRSAFGPGKRQYLALRQSVSYYDNLQKKWIKLTDVPLYAESEKLKVGIRGITILRNGIPVVIGYSGDIMIYDSSLNQWKNFMDPTVLRKNFGEVLLPLDILADEQDLYISTESDGLFIIDISTKKISRLKAGDSSVGLPSNQLLSLRADPSHADRLWIGSYEGLILLNKKTLHCEVFSLREGLPDNTIYSIVPDALGKFWLSTNKGICRFDPETHQVRAFHTIDGLPGDEFNRFHQLEFQDGRLAFGGTDGWTIFNPLRIKNDLFEPMLAFTDLKINNKESAQLSDHHTLKLPVNALNQLTLPYEQNTLSFSFAGLEFSQPQDLQYRYKLEGYDNDWVMSGNSRQANYTKIPPGSYTLFVNASNTSGKWSSHIKSLKIKIESPWYSTRMAYLCYCIILAGLTWTFIRFRVSRIVLREEMALKERETDQLKELDDMKSKFFSNITHEFRTPLTLIMGPAEQLRQSNNSDPRQGRLADTIVNNAKQLLILINRLMDLSKLEAKALRLHEQRGNPGDAVGSVVHSFESDAEAKNIRLLFDDQTGPMDSWFFADALERIVYNLVSNALKFTASGGEVQVILSKTENQLQLIVQDNGSGIEEKKLPHIFDRFYQADENAGMSKEAWDQGTGIGLSLVKELVNQMHGSIEVSSKVISVDSPDSGTRFLLKMPYRQSDDSIINPQPGDSQILNEKLKDESEKIPQILLVEDSIELAGFIIGILSETYQVTHVLNGALGLESAISIMPDLILSDVMMPVMDGYELCINLKEDIRTSHIPVILLTAKAAQENLITGLTSGADDYLTKPFHPTELLLRMHNLLARQEKIRERIRQELGTPGNSPAEEIPQDIFITRLYEVLESRLDDELFGVDQILEEINMSRSSLHRKLKAITGMSTTEVVRNYRLKRATQFLKEGFSSTDAAYKTGFGSPAYFSKSFREVYGITPGEYIKNAKSR